MLNGISIGSILRTENAAINPDVPEVEYDAYDVYSLVNEHLKIEDAVKNIIGGVLDGIEMIDNLLTIENQNDVIKVEDALTLPMIAGITDSVLRTEEANTTAGNTAVELVKKIWAWIKKQAAEFKKLMKKLNVKTKAIFKLIKNKIKKILKKYEDHEEKTEGKSGSYEDILYLQEILSLTLSDELIRATSLWADGKEITSKHLEELQEHLVYSVRGGSGIELMTPLMNYVSNANVTIDDIATYFNSPKDPKQDEYNKLLKNRLDSGKFKSNLKQGKPVGVWTTAVTKSHVESLNVSDSGVIRCVKNISTTKLNEYKLIGISGADIMSMLRAIDSLDITNLVTEHLSVAMDTLIDNKELAAKYLTSAGITKEEIARYHNVPELPPAHVSNASGDHGRRVSVVYNAMCGVVSGGSRDMLNLMNMITNVAEAVTKHIEK